MPSALLRRVRQLFLPLFGKRLEVVESWAWQAHGPEFESHGRSSDPSRALPPGPAWSQNPVPHSPVDRSRVSAGRRRHLGPTRRQEPGACCFFSVWGSKLFPSAASESPETRDMAVSRGGVTDGGGGGSSCFPGGVCIPAAVPAGAPRPCTPLRPLPQTRPALLACCRSQFAGAGYSRGAGAPRVPARLTELAGRAVSEPLLVGGVFCFLN